MNVASPLSFPNVYPKRPPFFAHRFCRLLTKMAVANDIGPEGVVLLMTIAHLEDSVRYTKPISYWNDQLAGVCGFGSWDRLARVRQRCIDTGWMHYDAGRKGTPGRYWVTIPSEVEATDDGSTGNNDPQNAGENIIPPQNAGQFTGQNAGESDLHPRFKGSSTGETTEHSPLSQDIQERESARARVHIKLAREKIRGRLAEQSVAANGQWLQRWVCIARDYGEADRRDADEITDCLMWSIRTARLRGKRVDYPEHVIEEAREWLRTERAAYRSHQDQRKDPTPCPIPPEA